MQNCSDKVARENRGGKEKILRKKTRSDALSLSHLTQTASVDRQHLLTLSLMHASVGLDSLFAFVRRRPLSPPSYFEISSARHLLFFDRRLSDARRPLLLLLLTIHTVSSLSSRRHSRSSKTQRSNSQFLPPAKAQIVTHRWISTLWRVGPGLLHLRPPHRLQLPSLPSSIRTLSLLLPSTSLRSKPLYLLSLPTTMQQARVLGLAPILPLQASAPSFPRISQATSIPIVPTIRHARLMLLAT